MAFHLFLSSPTTTSFKDESISSAAGAATSSMPSPPVDFSDALEAGDNGRDRILSFLYENVVEPFFSFHSYEGLDEADVDSSRMYRTLCLRCLQFVLYGAGGCLLLSGFMSATTWLWMSRSDLTDFHRTHNDRVRTKAGALFLSVMSSVVAMAALVVASSTTESLLREPSVEDHLGPRSRIDTCDGDGCMHSDVASTNFSISGHPNAASLLGMKGISGRVTSVSASASVPTDKQMVAMASLCLCLVYCSLLVGYLIYDSVFSALYGTVITGTATRESSSPPVEPAPSSPVAGNSMAAFVVASYVAYVVLHSAVEAPVLHLVGLALSYGWTLSKIIRLFMSLRSTRDQACIIVDGILVLAKDKLQGAAASSPKDCHAQLNATTADASGSVPTDPMYDEKYWYIRGAAYDAGEFVKNHPGGREAILLGRGRDCTALFDSYHPFSMKRAKQVLRKYRVEDAVASAETDEKTAADANKVATTEGEETGHEDHFYSVLTHRVEKTLREKGVDPVTDRGASVPRYAYYGFILSIVTYCAFQHVVMGNIYCSLPLGIFCWLLGSLGHDAGHFAVSRTSLINDVGLVLGASFMGNPVMWQHQHTYAHHSYTNEFDHDPDLHHFHTFLRVHQNFVRKNIHKNQASRLFVIWAYTFVVFGTCFLYPRDMILSGTLHGMVDWTDKKRPGRVVLMYAHLILYTTAFMIVPFFTYPTWYMALLGCTFHIAVSSICFAFFSQTNHTNEAALDVQSIKDRDQHRDKKLHNSWAVAQVETSNNYATESTFWYLLSLGLNYQIEHHLFPSINHCHLHHISPIVRKTCEEYGVTYRHYDGWFEAIETVFDWLNKLAETGSDTDDIKNLKVSGIIEPGTGATVADAREKKIQ